MEQQLTNILENTIRHFVINNLINPLGVIVLIFQLGRELNPLNISLLGLIIKAFLKVAELLKNKKRIENTKSKKIFNYEFIFKFCLIFRKRKN